MDISGDEALRKHYVGKRVQKVLAYLVWFLKPESSRYTWEVRIPNHSNLGTSSPDLAFPVLPFGPSPPRFHEMEKFPGHSRTRRCLSLGPLPSTLGLLSDLSTFSAHPSLEAGASCLKGAAPSSGRFAERVPGPAVLGDLFEFVFPHGLFSPRLTQPRHLTRSRAHLPCRWS